MLKKYVERHYAPGKRDLYAAFILRCRQLALPGGRVAMVTQQSWMFLRSFADLRAVGEDMLEKVGAGTFRGLLRDATVETLVHLGENAFDDPDAAGAFVAVFTLTHTPPAPGRRLTAFRLVGPKSAEEKALLLQRALMGRAPAAVSQPQQLRFLTIPMAPLCYWLRERFFELLAGRTLGEVADVCQGLATADDNRFVRMTWEVIAGDWAKPVRERRWVPFEKGGGYGKWFGHHFWAVDWERNGCRIRATPGPRVQNEEEYFRPGWTYSYMARGSLGLRRLEPEVIFSHLSSAIFFERNLAGSAATVNCRFSSAVVRSISAKIQLNERVPPGCGLEVPWLSGAGLRVTGTP